MRFTHKLPVKKLLSTVTILFLCFNTFLSVSLALGEVNYASAESPYEGTTASWEKEHASTQDTWSWRNLAWEFGPYPSYIILLKNGTMVTDTSFIPVGEDFAIIINVRKGIFTGNETLGGAGLNWHIDILNVTNPQQMLGWANARTGYINYLIGEKARYLPPDWRNGSFTIWSEYYNRTEQAIPGPNTQFKSPPESPSIRMQLILTATNLWSAASPAQNLPATGTTTYMPGVKVGDWANYTMRVFTGGAMPPKTLIGEEKPTEPTGGMPSNGTARMEVTAVSGSNVTYALTMSDASGTSTTSHWIDVATGRASDSQADMSFFASDLTAGDSIYSGMPSKVNQTIARTVLDAQRLVNYYAPADISWDRSTGIIVGQNVTMPIGGETGPGPGPGPGPNLSRSFYTLNRAESYVNETATDWTIRIVGKFNATITPQGPYNVNIEVFNSHQDRIDFGYAAWAAEASPWRMIAVGKPGLVYAGFNEFWNFGKYDMRNQTVYSIARGSPFIMRVNVTSSNLANVTLAIDLDDNIKTYVNVTNWHMETRTEYGGWQYNASSGTYYWNSSVPVLRAEQVYGPYQEERWLWLPHRHRVNVTDRYWNYTTGADTLQNRTMEIWGEKMYFIYDHATQSFTVKQGYSYWSYDPALGYSREFQVLRPLNTSDLATRFFSLNASRSRAYKVGDKWVIDFVGVFNKTTYSTRSEYWISQPVVYRTDGRQMWADWSKLLWNTFQIAVDRMVAITKVFDSNGREVKVNMLMTDVNKPFTVQSILQGGEKFYSDIDAVGVRLQAGEGRWAPTESYWSNVEIRLTYNKYEGTYSSETWNRTERNVYTYGPHMTWKEVEETGFHDEYNMTTGTWMWVNSTYRRWGYVNVTEWYWAYYSLNQTALALGLPNPWINRNDKWIPWDDPAFKVTPSYAVLSTAGTNMSLSEGLIISNLNISFASYAPDARYWWEVTFGNRTFGPDYSQGWGEHTVKDWTSETVRYINSSGTGYQKWYVETPIQPFYTWYNGERYRVYETPYIVVNGVSYYINTKATYDFGSRTERTEMLLREPWDPIKQREPRYYQLLNGTKVYVEQGYKVIIRDVKLNINDAYKFDETGGRVYLPNQTLFSTYMDHAETDWGRSYQDPVTWQWTQPRFYELINGTVIFRDQPFEESMWNSTTGRYDLSNEKYSENATSLLVNFAGRGVFLNGTTLVELRDDGAWWQYSPSAGGYYLVMKNGTRITHLNPWNYDDRSRIVTIRGVNYSIGWPTEFYTGTYQNRTLVARGGGGGFVRNYYYTTWGGGINEMPYPDALATSWWNLENLRSNGGSVPSGKSIIVNGVKYPILKVGTAFYIINTSNTVTQPAKNMTAYYSKIGPDQLEFWNITQGGWMLEYGTFNVRMWQMGTAAGTLETTTGYDANSRQWLDWNKYGEDRENSTRYLRLDNGTRIDVYEGRYLAVWDVVIGGHHYYTLDQWDSSEMVVDPATGQNVWRQYITTLNGTKVYFDWGNNPANWVSEYHVELPGTNYTRLIPYVWENRTFLDKTYIYNITITNNWGITWQNGTSVAVGTNVKVWGTQYGPGIQVGRDGSGFEQWHNLQSFAGMAYFETIDGDKILCSRFYPFGWDYGQQKWVAQEGNLVDMQWSYINNNQTQGKKLVAATQSGLYIRLINNATRQMSLLDITSAGWQNQYPDYYVILANGSRLDFTYEGWRWFSDVGMSVDRSAVIGGQLYWSESYAGARYDVTDSGVMLKLHEGNYLVPSVVRVPVPKFNSYPTLWMNATSDHVLVDGSGNYFLINASDSSVLNLASVNAWWAPLSDRIRSDLFNSYDTPWEVRGITPRYNVTVKGVNYFVVDPSPTGGYWQPGMNQWDSGRYPSTFTFNGTVYPINYNNGRFRWRAYAGIIVGGIKYELQDPYSWKAVYAAPPLGSITIAQQNIYKAHTTWGPAYKWMLTDMPVITVRTVSDIVIGTPKWNMWGIRAYAIVPETGAVDLDGDLTTTDDQYFVQRISAGTDVSNRTEERMWVELLWEPNATIPGDEMRIGAWMGKVHNKWTFTWNETYIWYYAKNMSTVSNATLTTIQSTLTDPSTGEPKPGYWEISRMAQNTTWEDLKARARREGWDWFVDNTQEWEWMWFGTRQDYATNWNESGVIKDARIGLRYEFAGLLLYNDTNADNVMAQSETTHFFMPKSVGNVSFKSPGEDYGIFGDAGTLQLGLTDRVNFGVTFSAINGTLFPYDSNKPRDMWGWWGGNVYGADFGVPNINNKPTSSALDMMQFQVHFNASVNKARNATNNEAVMKIDERFGQWSIDPAAIDGRTKNQSGLVTYKRGLDVLQGRSLAASWYVSAFTNVAWNVMDERGGRVSTNNVTKSDAFDVSSSAAKFATVRMGGSFDWQKPISTNDTIRTYNVSSYTTPLGTFRASYVSDTGKSSAGFDLTESMYFLTVGFIKWDGYSVYHDPQTSAYTAKFGVSSEQGKKPTSLTCRLSADSVAKGESVTVSGAINASVNAQVKIQTSTDNGATWSDLATTTTASNGAYSYAWTPTSTGIYKVRAVWSGDDTYAGATSSAATLHVTGNTPTSITCTLSKTSVAKGDKVTISGAINASVSAPVIIQRSTDGKDWTDLATVTSSGGAYSYEWTATSVGTYRIRAKWLGDATYRAATSTEKTLTITEAALTSNLIYIVAVVAIFAIAAGAIFIIRRPKTAPV